MRKKRYPISQDFRIQNYLFSRVLETHYCRVFPFLYKSHRVRNFATFQKAPPPAKIKQKCWSKLHCFVSRDVLVLRI